MVASDEDRMYRLLASASKSINRHFDFNFGWSRTYRQFLPKRIAKGCVIHVLHNLSINSILLFCKTRKMRKSFFHHCTEKRCFITIMKMCVLSLNWKAVLRNPTLECYLSIFISTTIINSIVFCSTKDFICQLFWFGEQLLESFLASWAKLGLRLNLIDTVLL